MDLLNHISGVYCPVVLVFFFSILFYFRSELSSGSSLEVHLLFFFGQKKLLSSDVEKLSLSCWFWLILRRSFCCVDWSSLFLEASAKVELISKVVGSPGSSEEILWIRVGVIWTLKSEI